MLTSEHINNHFLSNPEWKRVFLANYPSWKPSTYIENAKELFEKNGYSFKIDREITNERMGHLVRMDLHGPPTESSCDGFIFGNDWRQCKGVGTIYAVEQLIIPAICEYEVEFTNWK